MASGGQRDIQLESNVTRTAESEFWKFAKAGLGFNANQELTNAADGDTAAISISNPAGSGTTGVLSVRAAASAPSIARVYDGFSSGPTGGAAIEVENMILDGAGLDDDGVLTAASEPTYTATNAHLSEPLGGGRGGVSVGGSMNDSLLMLEPDREIVIEVEKTAADGDRVTVTARWFEVPVVMSEYTRTIDVDEVYE